MRNPIAALGAFFLSRAAALLDDTFFIGEIFSRSFKALFNVPRESRRRFVHLVVIHVYYTGVRSLPLAGLLAVMAGLGLGKFVEVQGAFSLVGPLLIVLSHYLAPLLAMIVIAVRTALQVTLELSEMRGSDELRDLQALGADAPGIIALPRLLGIGVGTVGCCYVVTAVAILSMHSVVANHPTIGGQEYLMNLAPDAALRATLLGLFYGLVISLVSLRHGLLLLDRGGEVAVAASQAIVKSIVLCVLLTGLLSVGVG
ncbi:MAG: ABC transporter permease [Planctomycetota bacterium]